VSRRVAAGALAALALAGGAAVARSEGSDPSLHSAAERGQTPRVVAREQGGGAVAGLRLPASGAFALAYRHSYYREPAREWFVAGHDSFRLHSIASPSEAVLDYYALEGRKRRGRGGWLSLEPRRPPRYRELALIATAEGRRTLTVGERELPLFGPGEARHLTVSVER
jgi:hypothetical protein